MLTDRAEKNYLREEVPFSFPLWKSDAKVRAFLYIIQIFLRLFFKKSVISFFTPYL